jgi:hypothetical protein
MKLDLLRFLNVGTLMKSTNHAAALKNERHKSGAAREQYLNSTFFKQDGVWNRLCTAGGAYIGVTIP